MDWRQFVGFIEGGRVARDYTMSTLISGWKVDLGLGIRAMVAGSLVRFDMATSDERAGFWVMVEHPF